MRPTALRLRRLERGLMQLELARRAGIHLRRLSAIESGQVEAQPDELHRINAALEVGILRRAAPSARL